MPRSILQRGELCIVDPAYKGKATTNLEYIFESIFLPGLYVIPGDWEESMPTTFAVRIMEQELTNICALNFTSVNYQFACSRKRHSFHLRHESDYGAGRG